MATDPKTTERAMSRALASLAYLHGAGQIDEPKYKTVLELLGRDEDFFDTPSHADDKTTVAASVDDSTAENMDDWVVKMARDVSMPIISDHSGMGLLVPKVREVRLPPPSTSQQRHVSQLVDVSEGTLDDAWSITAAVGASERSEKERKHVHVASADDTQYSLRISQKATRELLATQKAAKDRASVDPRATVQKLPIRLKMQTLSPVKELPGGEDQPAHPQGPDTAKKNLPETAIRVGVGARATPQSMPPTPIRVKHKPKSKTTTGDFNHEGNDVDKVFRSVSMGLGDNPDLGGRTYNPANPSRRWPLSRQIRGSLQMQKAGAKEEEAKIVCPWWHTYGVCTRQKCPFAHADLDGGIYQRLICPFWLGIYGDGRGCRKDPLHCEFAHRHCKHGQWARVNKFMKGGATTKKGVRVAS